MRKFLFVLVAGLSVCAVNVGVAQAAACGTVTTSTVLSANCDAPLTVAASGITVDLAGHSVVCNTAVDGIVVGPAVSNSTVRNGSVRNGAATCVNGVNVSGGSNQFTLLTVRNGSGSGFLAPGSGNRYTLVTATGFADAGFISIGGNDNVVLNSNFSSNLDDGASFFIGSGNTIRNSFATGNVDKGIISGSSNTLIAGNIVARNANGIWLSDGATGSSVKGNIVLGNGHGIVVHASTGNSIIGNLAFANGLDLQDENPNCDADTWTFNVFATADPLSCIH
jgi:parallel beta-helix repeat protein